MLCYIFYGERIIIIAAASLPDCTFFIPKYVFFKNVTSKKIISQTSVFFIRRESSEEELSIENSRAHAVHRMSPGPEYGMQ